MHHTDQIFIPIKKRRAFEQVAERIQELIFQGVLKPGDKLPSEAELAKRYEVGRQTIREAMRFLEISGFISTQKGGAGGAYIQDAVLHTITNAFVNATRLKKVTIGEVLDVRLEIEKLVIKYTIKNRTGTDIEGVKEILDKGVKKVKSRTYTGLENVKFHKALAEASRNQVLVIFLDLIMAVIDDFITSTERGYDQLRAEIENHRRILEAIIEGNEEKAIKHLEKHVARVRNRLKS